MAPAVREDLCRILRNAQAETQSAAHWADKANTMSADVDYTIRGEEGVMYRAETWPERRPALRSFCDNMGRRRGGYVQSQTVARHWNARQAQGGEQRGRPVPG